MVACNLNVDARKIGVDPNARAGADQHPGWLEARQASVDVNVGQFVGRADLNLRLKRIAAVGGCQ